ncbi:MAG: YutD family protein [Streptococcaceae bacterium]|jgi:uncharacterized protein YutD|nr:YutD family protein [Streptococcaceae bacterium]
MAKEIPEELKNYNKYPGEQTVVLPAEHVKIGEKNFRLVKNYKEGFDALALEQRYGHVFDKFDYVVGDWGHELLRLRGFYENKHKHVDADEKIDHLADYLQEYCAYGCAYFVLHRERSEGEVDKPFVADREDLQTPKKARQRNHTNKNREGRENRQSNRSRTDDGFTTVRPDSGTKLRHNNKETQKSRPKRENKFGSKFSNSKPKSNKSKFTIRERKD